MLCKELTEKIEEVYPVSYACEWDNVGLLVGRANKEVKSVYLALDVTEEVIREAVRVKADLLITHHPLIFKGLKKISDQDFIGNRVVQLLQHDISYYAMHTNYDVLRMADLAANRLGLQSIEVLEQTEPKEPGKGIGKSGQFASAMTVRECCELVKERFALSNIKVFGDLDRKIQRVAVCPGSGKSVIGEAIRKKAEVLITGDIDHHSGIDAEAQGLTIMDAGHYGMEHIFIEDMRKFLEERFEKLDIKCAPISHPFSVV